MDNNINFKGAFWLKQPTKTVKRDILPVLGKHRQIFNNFTQEGDILYITRKGCDKNVAEFITHHRTEFEYYPTLSTKSGFDDEKPKEALEIISKCGTKPITKRGQLAEYFKLKPFDYAVNTKRKNNTITQSLKALGLDSKETVVKEKNGYFVIKDAKGNLLAKISGPGQYGISFAYVEPKNFDESPLRYAIRNGEIIFQYTSESGRKQFLINYNKAVKANKNAPV